MKISTWVRRFSQSVLDNFSAPHSNAEPRAFRRWSLSLLGTLTAVLGALATTVLVIDPLMQYHKPWFGLRWVMWKEDFLNPGLAKNWPHDAVVIGGSFVQNTKVSEINALFGLSAIKLTNSAAYVPRIRELIDLSFRSQYPVRAIFVSLPMSRYTRDVREAPGSDAPTYLYDQIPLNDWAYWFSEATWGHLIEKMTATRKKRNAESLKLVEAWLDDAYAWYPRYKTKFSKSYVLSHYVAPMPQPSRPQDGALADTDYAIDHYLLPYITEHPETTFYFFQPPHSRLFFRDAYVAGRLNEWLGSYQRFCERLLPFANVRIFQFMNFGPYSDNLDNYKDRSHYHPNANTMIFEAMKTGQYQVNSVPSQADLDALIAWARDYDDPDIPEYQEGGAGAEDLDDAAAMANNPNGSF